MAAQLPDRIAFNGEQLELYSNPLEPYWNEKSKKRPALHRSDECKRGYIADWEVKDSELFIVAITGTYQKRFLFFGRKTAPYTLKALFPKSKQRPVKAVWFSGKLRIPHAKMTMFEDSGYDSRFEKEIIITIEKGKVLKVVTLDFTQKKLIVNSDVV